MKKLGLIGFPLTHSFSAKYFQNKFLTEGIKDYQYDAYSMEKIEKLPYLLAENPTIEGFNVTIPYKEKVLPYLTAISETAEKIGAVNVVKVAGNQLIGHNSDYHGFKKSLLEFVEQPQKVGGALVLGTGGASKAIKAVLQDLSIPFLVVSRSGKADLSYGELQKNHQFLQQYPLIINCTPLGTFPAIEEKPDLPYQHLTQSNWLFDLVYNPAETAFMKAGLAQGAKVQNGYDMLVEQAEVSWRIWLNDKPFEGISYL